MPDFSRRTALKRLGATGIGFVSLGVSGAVANEDPFETATPNELTSDSSEVITTRDIGFNCPSSSKDCDGRASVHWFSSEFDDGEWEHDFAICGAGGGITDWGLFPVESGAIQGHSYSVDPGDGELWVNSGSHIGATPYDEDEFVPEFTVTMLQATVEETIPGLGWVEAGSSSIREELGRAEGYSLGDGFSYTDTRTGDDWKECAFYARMRYESDEERPVLTTTFELRERSWDTLEIDVGVNNTPICTHPPCPYSENDPDEMTPLSDPHEMTDEEIKAFGVKRVDERDVMSLDDPDQAKTGDDNIPKFIATESPLEVTDVRRSQRKECRQ